MTNEKDEKEKCDTPSSAIFFNPTIKQTTVEPATERWLERKGEDKECVV